MSSVLGNRREVALLPRNEEEKKKITQGCFFFFVFFSLRNWCFSLSGKMTLAFLPYEIVHHYSGIFSIFHFL